MRRTGSSTATGAERSCGGSGRVTGTCGTGSVTLRTVLIGGRLSRSARQGRALTFLALVVAGVVGPVAADAVFNGADLMVVGSALLLVRGLTWWAAE